MSSRILKPADPARCVLFFQNSPLPCLILRGQTLEIIQANPAAATFFGCTPAQLENQFFTDVIASDPAVPTHGLFKKLRAPAPLLLHAKTPSGTTAVQVISMPLQETEELFGVMLVTGLPGTAPKEDLLADMANESSDVLTAADLDFQPLTWTKAAERLYGVSREQAIGNNVRDYIEVRYSDYSAAAVRETARTVGEWRGEMSFVRPTDGKTITLLTTFKLIRNRQGEPQQYVISATDLTDHKEAEAKLRESENRFREVADTAPVGIWMSEAENKVIYINKPLADYTGVGPQEFNETIWVSLVHPDDVHEVLKKFRSHYLQRRPVTLIYRFRNHNGAYRWVQDSCMPRLLPDGTFLGYIGSIIDIHKTKQHEEQLQYQATLMNSIQDSVITTDLDFVVQSCNQVAATVLGIAEKEMLGKRLPDLLQFKYITTTKEQALHDLQKMGVWKGEVDMDVLGEERNFLFTVTYVSGADGRRMGIMVVGHEITGRKRAEKALQQSEAFYRSLIADSIDGKLLIDADGTVTFASPSLHYILGYEATAICGRNAFEFVHPDDQASAWAAFQLEVADQSQIKFLEIRILKPDGTWLWCLARAHNLLANPHVGSVVISLHDDSQRKQAADALKESEQRFRALIKDLRLGVTLEDAEGRILMYNKATADLFRVPEPVLETTNVYELFEKAIHEDERPFERADWPMRRAAATKKPVEDVIIGFTVAGTGEQVWLLVNANPVLDEAGNIRHIISSFSDITERKKLVQRLIDEQLNQQRLLTQATIDGQERERKEIGKELHDNIGQQLATTKLYLDMASDMEAPERAEMLSRAAKSISDIISEVRSLSHALVPPALGDLGLVESVNDLAEAVGLLQNLCIKFRHCHFNEDNLPENVKLTLYRIIQEALNNIIKHAQASIIHIQLSRSKGFVLLRIHDNGQGFAPDKVRKGLGLNNIRNRAELFGGNVIIKTAPGAGCTLNVMVPDRCTATRF